MTLFRTVAGPARFAIAATLMLLAASPAALAVRDPFEPPAAARAAAPSAALAAPAPVAELPPVRHLIHVDGRRYVLDGARRYGVGDRFGSARIECIGDAGIVVRDAGVRRLLPMFGGIVKRVPAGGAETETADCPMSLPTPLSTLSPKAPR